VVRFASSPWERGVGKRSVPTAYAYFLKMSPPLDDEYNRAEQVVNDTYKENDMTKDYVIMEYRVELAGYHCGEEDSGNYAKRPRGAVIARSMIQ